MHREQRLKIKIYKDDGPVPAEVKHVIELIKNQLGLIPDELEQRLGITDYALCWKPDEHWMIGSNFEDGSSSCFWNGTEWRYLEPFEGRDTTVPGGMLEVVGNTICLITRGEM